MENILAELQPFPRLGLKVEGDEQNFFRGIQSETNTAEFNACLNCQASQSVKSTYREHYFHITAVYFPDRDSED